MPQRSKIIAREIRVIKSSFNKLARSFGRIAPLLAEQAMLEESGRRPRKRPTLTPEQRRALKLQGKYMGTMRGLKPSQRVKVKKIRSSKGIRAAIAEAQRLSR